MREQFAPRLKQHLQALKQSCTVFRRGPTPGGKCTARRRNGCIHVFAIAKRKPADGLFGGGIDDCPLIRPARIDPLAIDEELVQVAVSGKVVEGRHHPTRSFMR